MMFRGSNWHLIQCTHLNDSFGSITLKVALKVLIHALRLLVQMELLLFHTAIMDRGALRRTITKSCCVKSVSGWERLTIIWIHFIQDMLHVV